MGLLWFSERMGWIYICGFIKQIKIQKKETVFSLIHVLSARFIVNHHVASIHKIKLCSSVSYYIYACLVLPHWMDIGKIQHDQK